MIALDSFDNGGEAPALDVKLDGVVLVRQRFNGQGTLTGPVFKDSQGREQILGTIDKFEDLIVTLKPDGALTVKWRGFDIYVNLPTGFRPRAGQFALAARTGGLWDNHWVDELSITTSTAPAAGPWVKSHVPKAGYTAMGGTPITFEIQDGSGTSLNPATIVLKFDSVEIPVTPTKVGNVTTISYDPPGVLATESTHLVELTFSDNGTPATASVYSFGFTVSSPFTPDTLFIEAEDFNFGHGDWVKDRPTGMSGPYSGDAYQDLGTGVDGTLGDGTDLGIDYFEVAAANALPADQNGGNRSGTGVEAGKRNGPAG
ncbi:MAG: hypothetical protein Q7R41_01225, partial [Phycisphaerales bacterium]|nr:hypothetical protein [Phycisphaerales bacterium]